MYTSVSGVAAGPAVAASVVAGGTIADQTGVSSVISSPNTGIAPIGAAGAHHEWLLAAAVLVLAVWTVCAAMRILPRLLPKREV
jgi:hypothetical protein